MFGLPTNDTTFIMPPKHYVTILQIEVFKIEALAVEVEGYRICLRLKSNRGLAWSEIFVEAVDAPVKLDSWKLILQPFVGKFEFSELTAKLLELNQDPTNDQRAIYLYSNALHQLKFMPDPKVQDVSQSEDILKKRAIAYFSI